MFDKILNTPQSKILPQTVLDRSECFQQAQTYDLTNDDAKHLEDIKMFLLSLQNYLPKMINKISIKTYFLCVGFITDEYSGRCIVYITDTQSYIKRQKSGRSSDDD